MSQAKYLPSNLPSYDLQPCPHCGHHVRGRETNLPYWAVLPYYPSMPPFETNTIATSGTVEATDGIKFRFEKLT